MLQSTLSPHALSAQGTSAREPVCAAQDQPPPDGLHVAIIMDGNGRWAQRRGLPRGEGHRAGAGAVRRTVRTAPALGVGTLTLYAFSSDNWRRPAAEVRQLMRLLRSHLRSEARRCEREGVRLCVIGRRDRLDEGLLREIESVEARTRGGRRLHLQLAIDYSARDAMVDALRLHHGSTGGASSGAPTEASGVPSREEFARLIARALHAVDPIPDVDLLIRTGGEQRLSDFLLWECAYAELIFTPCLWPDFDAEVFRQSVVEFRGRERRFGALPLAAAGGSSHV